MQKEYLGVLDDVFARIRPGLYEEPGMLQRILSEALVYGAPGLLNDGYLVQHKVLLELLLSRDPGFLELLDRDLLTVASAVQPPSASIARRAAAGVQSHLLLVESADWPRIAMAIDDLPTPNGDLTSAWPSRDLTDGFARLVKMLRDAESDDCIPMSEGMPSGDDLLSFCDRFLAALEVHYEAPRTQWERLVTETWGKNSAEFLAMMDAANAIYHLNITMLLGADDEADARFVTRDTDLLAPLLGAEREDEVVPLGGVSFADTPAVNPSDINALLNNPATAPFRADAQTASLTPDRIVEYVDVLSNQVDLQNLLVVPNALGEIHRAGASTKLTVTRFKSAAENAHVRMTIPRDFCLEHAASARVFAGAP